MAKREKRVHLYKAYRFGGDDKDPVIHKIHTMLDDEGTDYTKAAELSGVSRSTIVAWIEGATMRPKYCTIAAVAGALGYQQQFVKVNGKRKVA
jgi:hypothetical protein